jgi:hypothetical protein
MKIINLKIRLHTKSERLKIVTQRSYGLLAAMIVYQYNIDCPVVVPCPGCSLQSMMVSKH